MVFSMQGKFVLALHDDEGSIWPPLDTYFHDNGLTHWGLDKMDAISQTTLSKAFSWIKMLEIRLIFHWSLFLRVKSTILHYLNQWWSVHWRKYVSLGLNELKQLVQYLCWDIKENTNIFMFLDILPKLENLKPCCRDGLPDLSIHVGLTWAKFSMVTYQPKKQSKKWAYKILQGSGYQH